MSCFVDLMTMNRRITSTSLQGFVKNCSWGGLYLVGQDILMSIWISNCKGACVRVLRFTCYVNKCRNIYNNATKSTSGENAHWKLWKKHSTLSRWKMDKFCCTCQCHMCHLLLEWTLYYNINANNIVIQTIDWYNQWFIAQTKS
jgi:hypothetical protein